MFECIDPPNFQESNEKILVEKMKKELDETEKQLKAKVNIVNYIKFLYYKRGPSSWL